MSGVTRGAPDVLAAYTEQMTGRVAVAREPLRAYDHAVQRLIDAPSDLAIAVPNRAAWIGADLDDLERLDRQPAVLAAALRLVDRLQPLGTGIVTPFQLHLRQLLRAPDLATQLRRHEAGEQVASQVREVIDSDVQGEELHRELAEVLAQLDPSDPVMVAAFHEALGAEGLVDVLTSVERAIDPYAEHDPEALAAILEPLGTSLANAADLGVVDEAFVDTLLADTTADNRTDRGTTLAVSQLLLYGDPLATESAHLTAGLASMVLADGFRDATQWMHSGRSPWEREDGDVFGDGAFHVEAQVLRAAEALRDQPEAAYELLLVEGNQRALLDRAAEGWSLGEADGGSEILEAGLLAHPLEAGMLDDLGAASDLTMAMRTLVTEVGGRDEVHASFSRGLGNVLAPHGDSVGRSVSRNAVGDDLLRVDEGTLRAYLANTLRHEPGAEAVTDVFADWTADVFVDWSSQLVPESGATLASTDADYTLDLGVVRDQYTLLEGALGDAGQSYADDNRLLYLAVDEADRAARTAVLREAGWSGGPKGRLASEALSRATSTGTGAIKDRIDAAGPDDVGDLQAELHDRMPNLAIDLALGEVPAERYEELVPVDVGPRPVEVDAGWFDQAAWWREDTVTEQRELDGWGREQRDAWIEENMAALDERGGQDPRQWWLNVHISNVEDRFTAPHHD